MQMGPHIIKVFNALPAEAVFAAKDADHWWNQKLCLETCRCLHILHRWSFTIGRAMTGQENLSQ